MRCAGGISTSAGSSGAEAGAVTGSSGSTAGSIASSTRRCTSGWDRSRKRGRSREKSSTIPIGTCRTTWRRWTGMRGGVPNSSGGKASGRPRLDLAFRPLWRFVKAYFHRALDSGRTFRTGDVAARSPDRVPEIRASLGNGEVRDSPRSPRDPKVHAIGSDRSDLSDLSGLSFKHARILPAHLRLSADGRRHRSPHGRADQPLSGGLAARFHGRHAGQRRDRCRLSKPHRPDRDSRASPPHPPRSALLVPSRHRRSRAERRPGFVWCGQLRPATYPAKWLNERLGIPYGILVHGGDLLGLQHKIHQSRVKRSTAKSLLSSAAVIVANSRWTRDLCHVVLGELGLDDHEGRVRIVPLGTEPAQFRPGVAPEAIRRRYGLDGGRWLLTVARLVPHKGVDVTLHALAGLAGDHPDLRYAVVGRGDHQPALESLARELGLKDRVRFLTEVNDADLPAIYNAADRLRRGLAPGRDRCGGVRDFAARGVGVRVGGRGGTERGNS